MPRVHKVKSAKKDYPNFGISKGDSYYWWKFRYGMAIKSLKPPRASQLTQSPFLGELYDIQDEIGSLSADEYEGLSDPINEIVDRITALGDQCQESLDNMPDSLQYSPTGELLQERIDAMEGWAEEIDGIDTSVLEDDNGTEEDRKELAQGIIDEIQSTNCDI